MKKTRTKFQVYVLGRDIFTRKNSGHGGQARSVAEGASALRSFALTIISARRNTPPMEPSTSHVVHTRLTAEFPELAHLSYAVLVHLDYDISVLMSDGLCRREDLEDLLADPQYFQAIFHTVPQVKLLYQGQAELGSANESIASTSYICSRRDMDHTDCAREQPCVTG